MTYQVLLTDRAAGDLDEAYQWCAERAPEAAVGWYNGFLDALGSLGHNPERCPVAAETRKLSVEIRQLLYGRLRSYRALFLVREQTVVVLHIRHTARREANPEDLLQSET
ncbi:MAG: type II toxin-antitoxin system RelE/ParE family toxin [Planctomycetes bacterium]|nr:type II toxin-antitoxin system RelE/ParE family toxin [Planctomycetota bacterium]MBU4399750.1 type II toxin-antitoxin system RelE/ParE family toxin [Planctomycetota bacterium]MCG2684340.1 type II toxin-antitoxin system RelE/ParE family toxin [Planctomycetales bacterium]